MICISLAKLSFDECKKILKSISFAEIRLDTVTYSENEIQNIFSQPVKLIATCRPGKYSEEERLFMLKTAITSGASYVDIEIESNRHYLNVLLDHAKKYKCKIIISYHNYNETPTSYKLEKIMEKCFIYEADIAKIATMSNNMNDNAKLLSLYSFKEPVIAIGMGNEGKFTRIAALMLGAPFTFASLSEKQETAPGQLTVKEIDNIVHRLKEL